MMNIKPNALSLDRVLPRLNIINVRPTTNSDKARCNSDFGPPIKTHEGFFVSMHAGYRFDFGLNDAIRIFNNDHQIAVAINLSTGEAAIVHKSSRAYLKDGAIEVYCEGRYSKLADRGVSFMAVGQTLCYLITEGGCKTSSERFQLLTDYDLTALVLHNNANQKEEQTIPVNRSGEYWFVNGFRIWHQRSGEMVITKYPVRIFISFNDDGHIKVKMNEFKMSIGFTFLNINRWNESLEINDRTIRIRDGKLVAQCEKQEAGLDRNGQLFIK